MSRVNIPTTSRQSNKCGRHIVNIYVFLGEKTAPFCGNPNPYPDDSQAVNGSQHAGVGLPPEAKLRHGINVLRAALALLQFSGAVGTASAAKARTASHTRMRVTDMSHSERTFPTVIIKRRLQETASSLELSAICVSVWCLYLPCLQPAPVCPYRAYRAMWCSYAYGAS